MTVALMTTINHYIGLSTDTKPTSVPVGSAFHEYNTRTDYVTYDGTNWVVELNEVKELSVSKTLIKGTEPININLFSFTGPFRFRKMWGVCTEATDSSDIDDAFFNIYDGTNTVDLSDDQSASGATLTNMTVGSVIGINAAATNDMFYQKSDQCRYLASQYAGSELWQRGLIVAKNGVTNYVRFTYDSAADSTLDLDIEFYIVYVDVSSDIPSALVAV